MYTKQLHSCRNMKTMVPKIFLVLPVIFFGGIFEVESAVEGGCGWNLNCSSPIRGRYIPPATPPKYVGNPYVIEAEGPQRLWSGNRTNATIAGRAAVLKSMRKSTVGDFKKDLVTAGGKLTFGSQGETIGGAVDLGPVASGSSFSLHIPGFPVIPVAGAVSGSAGALSGEPGNTDETAASIADKLSKLPCKSLNGPAGDGITAGNSDGKVTKQVTTDNLNDAGLPRPIIKEIVEILETMMTQDYYNNGQSYISEKTIIEIEKDGEVPKLPVGKPETSILNKVILVDLDYDRVLDAFPKCLPRFPKTKRRKRYATEFGEKFDVGNLRKRRGIGNIMEEDDATKLSENNQDDWKIREKRETLDDLLKKKKKCRLVLKVKPRTPFCDDFFKKHPEAKGKDPESQIKDPGTAAGASGANDKVPHTKVTFKIEVMKDTEDKYFIKVSVTDVSKDVKKTTIYQKGDEYFITTKKKQGSSTGHPEFNFYIFKVLAPGADAAGDASALKALEEKMNFKNLLSIIWSKVNADTFCIKDIFLTPIEGANSICGDLPYVYNYLKQLEEQKDPKMASLLLQFDSDPYTRLFGPGSIFSFSDWYRVFQNVYAGGNYQGNRFQVKEEWVDNQGDYAKIQNITITWGTQNNIAKVDIATLKSGQPQVWRQEFNPDGTTFNPLCQKKKTAPQPYPM